MGMSVSIYLRTVNPRFSGPAKWKTEESPLLEDHGSSLEQDKPLPGHRWPYNGLPPSSSWLHHSLGPAGPAKRGRVIIPNVPGDRADARVGRSWKDVWVLRVLHGCGLESRIEQNEEELLTRGHPLMTQN